MRFTKKQLRRIIKESVMKSIQADIESYALTALSEKPGLDGMSVVNAVQGAMSGTEYMPSQEEIFSTLDDLLEDGVVLFDTEEDAWYDAGSPEANEFLSKGMV